MTSATAQTTVAQFVEMKAPEWRLRETQQYGPLLRLIADNLPPRRAT
jgi:hypothetical protein